MKKKNPFLGIAGNIGVGKTTFADLVSKHFGWKPYYESVGDNPYLNDFYLNMERWSFNLQVYFLQHRFKDQIEIQSNEIGVIQDRTIYEDVEIFAKNLYEMDYMSYRDWETYNSLFLNMTQFLRKPDLIIYLRASTDTLLSRIKKRDRNFEKNISSEYLHSLNILYVRWINQLENINVYVVESDKFNIFNDKESFYNIIEEIERQLS